MVENKPEFSVYIKRVRTNSDISPKIELVEQKVYYIKDDNGRCDFTIDEDIKMEDIPIEQIEQFIVNDKKDAIDGRLDYFTILPDKQGNPHRFCIHLKY